MMVMNNCHIKVDQATMNDSDKPYTMSSFPSCFKETDQMFLEIDKDLNTVGGVKTLAVSTLGVGEAIGVCVRCRLPVYCLRWVDVERECIDVVKCDLQRFFMLDFNDQAMNGFVEHQIFTSFKEFKGNCHRRFKKYSNPEQARANLPHILVGRMED
ncbi:CACTA en-spm transposon protein [Cucumis melo var. makuwa]|uniref:CACTA en-spm transposon protein n=1 Tax=Cucumis melo var. makuwa TaxID=1194695 RepID=A0A5A7V533_CUCMM|nr:CACTA en-spm transposon protein [Cucumis melo var. makuwa]TYK20616.1 CACTA en-spm transposon protein [Cucumis melo var. makuwa]